EGPQTRCPDLGGKAPATGSPGADPAGFAGCGAPQGAGQPVLESGRPPVGCPGAIAGGSVSRRLAGGQRLGFAGHSGDLAGAFYGGHEALVRPGQYQPRPGPEFSAGLSATTATGIAGAPTPDHSHRPDRVP